ncbi:MAG: oxygen-insensitive NADPH nitroreductase [Pseudomonadota bacterium]
MNAVIDLLKSHRSIRKFRDKAVPEALLRTILEAAQCASSSHYVQAYSVIWVTDAKVRKAVSDLAGSQVWVCQAPIFLIFCADLNRLETACFRHGKSMASGYAEQLITATVDTALLGQNTMIAAESQGLGGVFIGGIRNDPARVCSLLSIPDNAYPVFGMCLGYPDDDPGKKPRMPVDSVLMKESYDKAIFSTFMDDYDQSTCDYYLSRSSGARQDTWSRQMAEFMSRETRPHMKSFLESKGFFLK